ASPARVLAMVEEGRRLGEAGQGQTVEIILDRTPAYAESGGQMGDAGTIVGRDGQGTIEDTYYRGSQLIVHRVRVTQGRLRENEEVAVSVGSRRRQGLKLHHTGTHLLHAALRKILGTHVAQAGSLVAPDHLRFDFSHGEAVTGDAALRHVGREEQALRESAGLLKIPPLELPRRLQKLLDEQKQLEKQLQQLEARLAKGRAQELAASARVVAGVPVLAARLDGLDAEGLRSVVDTLRERMSSGVICLGSSVDGKVSLVASVSKDLTKRFAAGKLVQEVAPMVGG